MLFVALLAWLALHAPRNMKPFACRDALPQRFVVMTSKTLGFRKRLAIAVTLLAIVLSLK